MFVIIVVVVMCMNNVTRCILLGFAHLYQCDASNSLPIGYLQHEHNNTIRIPFVSCRIPLISCFVDIALDTPIDAWNAVTRMPTIMQHHRSAPHGNHSLPWLSIHRQQHPHITSLSQTGSSSPAT